MINPSPTIDFPGWCRRWLWVCFGVLFAGVACIAFLGPENPSAITVNLKPVGEIQTNGEHWVLFRLDAPKSRAVCIHQMLTVGGDFLLIPQLTRAECFPDPKLPVNARIKGGDSRLLKVRRVGGGNWRLRIDFVVPLTVGRQCLERSKASWRAKSLAPWNRTYIERGQRFIESDFVKTTETLVAQPQPAVSPWLSAISPSAFLPLPIPTDESGETEKGLNRGR